MRYSRRFTDFRRSPLYRELKRGGNYRAVSVYQNLLDAICEKYKARQGNGFTLTMPEEDWLREVDLHHHAKDTLSLVLEIAHSYGAVVYELLGSNISVSIPNIVEIADKYEKPRRNNSDSPPLKEKEKEENNLSSLKKDDSRDEGSSHFIIKVRSILLDNVRVAFAELPPVVESFFERHGDRANVINQVTDLIAAQFDGNEKQQQKGQQLIERVKVAYQSGLKSHKVERIVLTETSSARSSRLSHEQERRARAHQRLTASDEVNEPHPRVPKRKLPGHLNGAAK